jgi:hypothetical protein
MGYCELVPKVTIGDKSVDSYLYKDLEKRSKDRPLTNLVYSSYLQPGVAGKLDQMGKKRNKQGQHIARDVWEFFDVTTMQNEKPDGIKSVEGYNVKDENGEYVVYPFSEGYKLLDAVNKYNSTSEGKVKGTMAILSKRENGYSIILDNRNSQTQRQIANTRRAFRTLEFTKSLLKENNVDLEELLNDPNIAPFIDVNNIQDFFNILDTASKTNNKYLGSKLIAMLLSLNKEDSRINVLKNTFKVNTIEELSDKIAEALNAHANAPIVTSGRLTTINDLLDYSKKIIFKDKKHSLLDIRNELFKEDKNIIEFDEEFTLLHTLEELDKEYHIDEEIIKTKLKNIKSIKEYVAAALRHLEHEAKEIEKLEGITPETKELYGKAQKLAEAMEAKQFYGGCILFLEKLYKDIKEIDALHREYRKMGDTSLLETLNKKSKIIMDMHRKIEAGVRMVEIINQKPEIFLEGGLTQAELNQLKNIAVQLLPAYNKWQGKVEEYSKDLFDKIAVHTFGESAFDLSTGEISEKFSKNGTLYDFLYSMSEMDDPHLAVLGSVMRRQSDKKNAVLSQFKRRIDIANRKLVKATKSRDTSFMYEEDGHIISDIDWHAYNKARAKFKSELKNHGLSGIDLKVEMEAWESANLEERIVDQKSKRTERVPNATYRKPFPDLTPAQMDYYYEVMQIKGELGTLLPEEARRHYQPPQIRRSAWDALKAAVKGKDKTAYWRVFKNGFGDLFTVREDDTEFSSSGILIDGEELSTGRGDITGKEEKKVPIYYINTLADKRELMTDFSSALLHFASTAIQYNLTMEIRDTAEVLKMFIVSKEIDADENGKSKVEVWKEKGKIFVYSLTVGDKTMTNQLAEAMVESSIYGEQLNNSEKAPKLAKLLLSANSLISLGVNVIGAASNVVTGEANALIEAGAGEFFNLKNYGVAQARMAQALIGIWQKTADVYTDTVENKDSLISNVFDPFSESFEDLQGANRYNYTFIEKLLSGLTGLPLYQVGEWLMRKSVMYAVLDNEKVLYKGKKISLYKALTTSKPEFGEAELKFKDGVTDLNGNPLTSINSEYIENVRRKVRAANSSIHGAMNREDKGMIHRFLLGRAVMQFRQWMVAFYGKRFRITPYWDDNMKRMRRGYYINTAIQIKKILDLRQQSFKQNFINFWKDKEAMYDVKRVLYDVALMAIFHYLPLLLMGDDDDKKELGKLEKNLLYLVMRTESELKSGNPFAFYDFVSNLEYIINNPLPQTRILGNLAYVVGGIVNGDVFEDIEDGKYKGENKYIHELTYNLAPYKQVKRLYDDESLENLLNSFERYKELQGETTGIPMQQNGKALVTELADGKEYQMYLHKITKGENVNKWTVYVERISKETGEPYKDMLENGMELADRYHNGEDITTEGTPRKPRKPKKPNKPEKPKKEYRISVKE